MNEMAGAEAVCIVGAMVKRVSALLGASNITLK